MKNFLFIVSAFMLCLLLVVGGWYFVEIKDCDAIDPYGWTQRCIDSAREKARTGDRRAMTSLFFALDKPGTTEEAISWLRLAAAKGDIQAYRFLVSLCGKNSLVKRKLVEEVFAEGKITNPNEYISVLPDDVHIGNCM